MNVSRRVRYTVAFALMTFPFSAIGAQRRAHEPFFSIASGVGTTKGARFDQPGAWNSDILIGATLERWQYVSLTGAALGGYTSTGAHDAVCATIRSSNGHNYCMPTEPSYMYAGALLGLNTNWRPFAFGLTGGPAYVSSTCSCGANPDTQYGGNALGIDMRAEFRIHALGPMSLTFGGHSLFMPNLRSKHLRMQAFNFGLHVQ